MKILWLAVLAAVLLGGLVGTLLVRDAGYVLVAYGTTVLETSLWVAILLMLGFYLLLRAFTSLFRQLTKGQLRMSDWRGSRRLRTAREQTVRGLLVMSEGRWAEAQKLLLAGAEWVETPLINYLHAARTAHELGQLQQRDEYLKRAHETTPGAKFAVTLTQAEFHMDEGHFEQALAALLLLRKRAPKHGAVLMMLTKVYEALGDWQALRDLLPVLAQQKVLAEKELQRLQKACWRAVLLGEMPVAKAWKQLPKVLKTDAALLQSWVAHLLHQQRDDDADQALRLILAQFWDETLVHLYGLVRATDSQRQLVLAQSWAKERPNDAALLLSLGRLCLVNRKFEQARDYFEGSLRLQPGDEVYGELGRLCIAQGDEHRGAQYLLLAQSSLTDLPLPQPTRAVV